MKTTLMAALFALAFIGLLSGCVEYGPPRPIYYVSPSPEAIPSTDHIVVTNCLAGKKGAPEFTSFSMTITGDEMKRVIYATHSLRAYVYDLYGEWSGTVYEWQLQFYQGTKLLGTAELSEDFVFCNGAVPRGGS